MSLEWMLIRGSGFVALALLGGSVVWGLLLSLKVVPRSAKTLTYVHEGLSVGAVLAALAGALEPAGEALIFVAGPAGSGRTHLLSGQCAAAERRGLRGVYLPLREHRALAPDMLEGLETLDLVAVDDVGAIAGDDADDPRRSYLIPHLPFKVLATPVLGITVLLLAFEHIYNIGIFDPAYGWLSEVSGSLSFACC